MKRDTLKTLAGLLIIGVIVVATFMYGNAQRQAQIKRDEAAKKQQQAKANNDKALASASPSPTTQPTTGGTAAVQSPSSNNVQGGTQVTPTPSSSTKPPENGQVAGATAPTATPTPAGSPLPQTGPETAGALGGMAVLGSVFMLRRSKKSLYKAVRSPRM
jgi:LPXTG-motif cell wall-anchored protein